MGHGLRSYEFPIFADCLGEGQIRIFTILRLGWLPIKLAFIQVHRTYIHHSSTPLLIAPLLSYNTNPTTSTLAPEYSNMVLGRLVHYAADAVLLSTVVAGVRRSSGFSLVLSQLSSDTNINTVQTTDPIHLPFQTLLFAPSQRVFWGSVKQYST